MLADMKVLVVDDDAAVRDSLARTLKFEGHEVATAADGQRHSTPSTRTFRTR
jgi:DNA-binding response OmpR family regulator